LKKHEQKIDKIRRGIIDSDVVDALEYFKEFSKELTKASKAIKKLETVKDEFTLTELLDEVDLARKDISIVKLTEIFANDIERDLTFSAMNKDRNIKSLLRGKFFDGSKIRSVGSYQSDRHVTLDGKPVRCFLQSLILPFKDTSIVLLPNVTKKNYEVAHTPFVWAIIPKDSQQEALDYINEKCSEHSFFRNKFITVQATNYNSQLTINSKVSSKFNLDEVVLNKEGSDEVHLMTRMIKEYDTCKVKGIPFKRGLLLYGHPGTGKTVTTTAVIQEVLKAGGTVISFQSGSNAAGLTDVYELAQRLAPAIVVLEDYDLLNFDRTSYGNNSVTSQTLNTLDGVQSIEGVLTIATTNILEHIDNAAVRAGRIDSCVEIDYPDLERKKDILKLHLHHYDVPVTSEEVYKEIKHLLTNNKVTGAMIEAIVRSAMQKALSDTVTIEHFKDSKQAGKVEKSITVGFDS